VVSAPRFCPAVPTTCMLKVKGDTFSQAGLRNTECGISSRSKPNSDWMDLLTSFKSLACEPAIAAFAKSWQEQAR
jgi:hypothetical protein